MSDYTISSRGDATDYMAAYEGFGEMLSYTDSLGSEQVVRTAEPQFRISGTT